MEPTFTTARKPSAAPAVLYGLTAAGTLLSGLLPLFDYGDAKIFDIGPLWVLPLVVSAGLLVVAAVLRVNKSQVSGLGGGAALGVASLLGSLAILLWKLSEGDGLGGGSYMLTGTALLALVTAFVSLGTTPKGKTTPVHWLAVAAGFAMSLGCTLVPSELSGYGMSWADFNGFGDGGDGVLAFAVQLMLWAPFVAVLLGAIKGGRFGAMFGLGGSLALGWFIVAAKFELRSDAYLEAFSLSTEVHPLAIVGAVAVLGLTLVAFASSPAAVPVSPFGVTQVPYAAAPAEGATSASANPARWADDPFGRHASRYWSGAAWTDQVANGGVTSTDPPVPHPAPPSAPVHTAWSSPPTSAAPVGHSADELPTVLHANLSAELPTVLHANLSDDLTVQHQLTHERLPAATPELVLDSGQRVVLVGPLVIGRAPRVQVSEPTATLLAVDDPSMSMSATHLLVGPDPQGVWVEDMGSTNGSSVVDPLGATTVLLPGTRHTVVAGSLLRFGDRSATLLTGNKAVGGPQ